MNEDFIIVMFLLFFLFCKDKNENENENETETFTEITQNQANQIFANIRCKNKNTGDDCTHCDEGKTFGALSNLKTRCACKNGLCVNRSKIK